MKFLAIFYQLAFVSAAGWASVAHFKRGEVSNVGTSVVTVVTAFGTIINLGLALSKTNLDISYIAASLLMTSLAFSLFIAAVIATRGGDLHHAFNTATPSSIVRTGVYQFIRHPFYASYCVYWASWVFLSNIRVVSLSLLILNILIYVRAAADEEFRLIARHGDGYTSLKCSTWRLVPGLY